MRFTGDERGRIRLAGKGLADAAFGTVAPTAAPLMAAIRAQGLAAERRVEQEMVREGHRILGSQVTVRTPARRRVVDHLVQLSDGTIVAVEVKSGSAVRTASQIAKDTAMAIEGGTLVGKNAPATLRGQTLQINTLIRH